MEFACGGQPTAAAADHRFPHPPPPPYGHGDLAAARWREELMWELHLERIRQDIILRELAETTQRAMAARFAPPGHWPMLHAPPPSQGYWHHHWAPPSLLPWDEAEAAPPPPPPMTDDPPPPPPADDDGDNDQECRSPWAACHEAAISTVKDSLENGASGDQNRTAFRESSSKLNLPEGAFVTATANVGAETTMYAPSTEEVTPGEQRAVSGEPKHDLEDIHSVQLFYGSENQSSEQRETAEYTVKDQPNELVARPCQHGLASQENGASDEQKGLSFREPQSKLNLLEGSLVLAAANSGAEMTMSVLSTEGEQWAVGGKPKHGVADGHSMHPFYWKENQSSVQRETAESTMKDQTGELVARSCSEENGSSSERKRLAFREPSPQADGLKRKLTTAISPVTTKKQKPLEWTRNLSQSQVWSTPSPHNLLKLKKARNKPAKATPGASLLLQNGACGGNVPRPEDREPAPSWKWTCLVCDATCNSKPSLHDHLGSSRHHQNTEAILAKFKSSYDCRKDDGPVKTVYYCKACDVRCTGDTALASHLVGKKHRRKMSEERE